MNKFEKAVCIGLSARLRRVGGGVDSPFECLRGFDLASSSFRFAYIFGRCSLTCSCWANSTPLAMQT